MVLSGVVVVYSLKFTVVVAFFVLDLRGNLFAALTRVYMAAK